MTMTDRPELTILDVGHGNCALLSDEEVVFVIDVPKRDKELMDAIAEQEIDEIDAVLVSHGDEDHAGGVSGLLTTEGLTIRRLYMNPDAIKDTIAWEAVRIAMRDLSERCPEFEAHTQLTTTSTAELQLPRVEVRVLAPSADLAASGPGGKTIDGKSLSSNAMSAVIEFSPKDGRGIMFTGDIDQVGLRELLARNRDLAAEVLVFPHHGGLPGKAPPRRFAAELTAAVQPDVVVFSLRGGEETPQPEIVAGIRESCPDAHVACTELSGNCAAQQPAAIQGYLSQRPARAQGVPRAGSCCAGTLDFHFLPDRLECAQLPGHAEWVSEHLPERLCARYPAAS